MFKSAFLLIGVLTGTACGLSAIYQYTCFWYSIIDETGTIVRIDCNSTDVFDPQAGICVKPEDGNWPCADVKDCSTLPNKRYADINTQDPAHKCKSYYTCQNGYFYGHNYCPGNTVFNEAQQYCDWEYNVLPPCGSFTPTSTVTP